MRYLHKKRGTEYELLGFGKMQAERWFEPLNGSGPAFPIDSSSVDMREVAIYRSVDDGSLWVRPREEFEDGRFVVGFTIYEPNFPQHDLTGRVEVPSITSDRTSPSPIVDEMTESRARALALLQAEDERQDKIHELLETIREQIRVDVAPEHRPEGLMTNIQNAVYAMRGRMRLMNDAAITSPLQPPSAALPSPPKAGEAKNARDEIVTRILNMALIGRALSDRTDIEADLFVDELRSLVTDVFVNNRIYATPEPRADMREEDGGLDAGINYAIERLCEALAVDPNSISWDAATETMDGDVVSVICNVLRAAYGEKWSTKPEDTARIRAALDAALNPGGHDAR